MVLSYGRTGHSEHEHNPGLKLTETFDQYLLRNGWNDA